MAYLLRTYLKKKYLVHALTAVYGIGSSWSVNLCQSLGFQNKFLLKDLSDEDIYRIDQLVTELDLPIKGDLHRIKKQNIDQLASIRSYRGLRHRQGFPVRGQRTHTNFRTVRKLRRLGRGFKK